MSLFPERREVRCILSDPPWPERGAGQSTRGAQRHYDLARVRDIPDIMRAGMAELNVAPAADAHHWMWTTDNYLPGALWCLATLGFDYVRTAVWVKMRDPFIVVTSALARITATLTKSTVIQTAEWLWKELKLQIGLGQYLRGSHELLLLGVRGSGMAPTVRTDARDVPSVMFGRRGAHSRKPESSYTLIERVSKGPRVELFARSKRRGWISWGNEVDGAA